MAISGRGVSYDSFRRFKNKSRTRLKLNGIKSAEKEENLFSDIIVDGPPEKVGGHAEPVIPLPLNDKPFLGLDEKRLLTFGNYIEHLPFVLAAYHGTRKLLFNREWNYGIEDDPRTHLLRALSANRVLYFLAGFGQRSFPPIRFSGIDILPDLGMERQEAYDKGLDIFVFDVCVSGMRFRKDFRDLALPPFVDIEEIQLKNSIRNARILKTDDFFKRLKEQYVSEINFGYKKRAHRYAPRTGYYGMKGKIVGFPKEHYGREYMQSVIEFLWGREVKEK